MIIYGRNAIMETINANKAVYKLYVMKSLEKDFNNPLIKLAKKHCIKIEYLQKPEIEKMAAGGAHQGFVAEVEDFVYSEVEDMLLDAQNKGEQPFLVLLDRIEDPHNLGSILRVCECAGVHGVIIPKNRACPINQTVAKTSAGALSHIKVAKVTNLSQVIEKLKKAGLWVFSVELKGTDIYDQNLTGPLALVIGSEGFGTASLVKKHCDGIVTIPMGGKVNSLNASVAAGIAVFEALRQRRNR